MDVVPNEKQRKCFSLKEKYEIIKLLQQGVKQKQICQELGLSKSAIARIWKNKDLVLTNFEQNSSNIKKVKTPCFIELDHCLLKWFTQKIDCNMTITNAVLQAKTQEFGEKLNYSEFKCSESWIVRFKRRHNITSGKIVGEAAEVNVDVVNDWLRNKWPDIRKHFKDEDIFNGDEAGLFYKVIPNNALRFKGETCTGGKLSKERLTVFVVANMTGTEKRKLLVIGKSKNPRCFKNITKLPVNYQSNKKAWMTSEMFNNELRQWDNSLRRANRKILLLVDNCPAHPDTKDLECIKLVFMPPNTSSVLQPMDQGVIHALKSKYRHILLSKIVYSVDMGEDDFKVSILDAINFLHMAWLKVSKTTIANSFRHGGFTKNEGEFESDDDMPLIELISQPMETFTDVGTTSLNDYICFDDDLVTTEALDDDAILQSVCTGDDDLDDDMDNEMPIPVTTALDAMCSVNYVRTFLQSRDTPQQILDNLAQVELYINESNIGNKQTEITDFFNVLY